MNPCPHHGNLIHELVLGRLADADAVRAERTLAGCESCRSLLAALDRPEVARGVAEGVAAFRAPAFRTHPARPVPRPAGRRWPLRAAAVLALAAGGAAAWTAREALFDGGAVAGGETARPGAVILVEDLERGDLGELEAARRPEVIFADGLESGNLESWRSSS